jgi:hypothetical protein
MVDPTGLRINLNVERSIRVYCNPEIPKRLAYRPPNRNQTGSITSDRIKRRHVV